MTVADDMRSTIADSSFDLKGGRLEIDRFTFFLNLLRNISNTDLSSLATIFDIKLSNKKCRKWTDGFLAQNGTYEEQKMIFQTTRSLTSTED